MGINVVDMKSSDTLHKRTPSVTQDVDSICADDT